MKPRRPNLNQRLRWSPRHRHLSHVIFLQLLNLFKHSSLPYRQPLLPPQRQPLLPLHQQPLIQLKLTHRRHPCQHQLRRQLRPQHQHQLPWGPQSPQRPQPVRSRRPRREVGLLAGGRTRARLIRTHPRPKKQRKESRSHRRRRQLSLTMVMVVAWTVSHCGNPMMEYFPQQSPVMIIKWRSMFRQSSNLLMTFQTICHLKSSSRVKLLRRKTFKQLKQEFHLLQIRKTSEQISGNGLMINCLPSKVSQASMLSHR